MKQYDRIIIEKLLDSYERSSLYKENNKVNVSIVLNVTEKSLPEYFNQNTETYLEIHTAVEMLERENLADVVWRDDHKGHILRKIVLNCNNLKKAYEYVSRSDKKILCRDTVKIIESIIGCCGTPVTRAFSDYLIDRLDKGKSIKEYGDIYSPDGLSKLIQVVKAIEEFSGEIYLREFSVKAAGDSKSVESMKGTITKVFRRFSDGRFSSETFEEIMAEYGIYSTPNYVYFKGCGMFCIGKNAGTIDLSNMNQGIGISGEDMETLIPVNLSEVKRVVTIENLTSFFSFSEPECLIVYLGGYHNRIRRKMLSIIFTHLPHVTYEHFGDIDAGGFEIFFDLRNKTGIDFRPYKMDSFTLKEHFESGKRLTESDVKRLETMKEKIIQNDSRYIINQNSGEEIVECIEKMLENNLKLEQECITQ